MNSHGPQDDTNPDLPRSDVLSTAASAASIATAVYTLGKDIPKLLISNKKIINWHYWKIELKVFLNSLVLIKRSFYR